MGVICVKDKYNLVEASKKINETFMGMTEKEWDDTFFGELYDFAEKMFGGKDDDALETKRD